MDSTLPADEQRLLATRLMQLDLPAFDRENALAMIRRGVFIGGMACGAWQALERAHQRLPRPARPRDRRRRPLAGSASGSGSGSARAPVMAR